MKHTGDYELDEINMLEQECADLEEENKRLEEENKKLKSDLAFERTMLDNVRAEYKSLQDINKKLKEKIERWEKCFKKWWFNPQDVRCLMEEDTLQELRDIGEI